MRVVTIGVVMSAAIVGTAAVPGAVQEDKAKQIMAQLRTALGGEPTLASVKTLSLRATYQREMSMPTMSGGGRTMISIAGGPAASESQQISGDIELDVALPDKYIKVDTSTGFMAMTRTEGFDGDRPFAHAASANPGMRIRVDRPGDDPERTRMALQRNQAELARLLLGILGAPQESFPVTYTYGGVAESPDGKADIIDVNGPESFAAKLFLDVQTHLPLMLTYMAPQPRIVMSTAQRGRGGEAADHDRLERERQGAEATPPPLVEHRIFFSAYRDVDSLILPHRIARGTAQKTTEEWEVKRYRINPTLKADRFKIS